MVRITIGDEASYVNIYPLGTRYIDINAKWIYNNEEKITNWKKKLGEG